VLAELMRFNGGQKSREFMNHIRQYNCLFNFTSLGAKIDNSINDGHGPYVFRISGQLSHKMGTLKPANGQNPKFAYMILTMRLTIESRLCVLICVLMVMLMAT
jgi:hypothetical protein